MLMTADLHLGLPDIITKTKYPLKCRDTRTRIFELFGVAEKTKQPVVVAGDVFDKANPPAYANAMFLDLLNSACRRGVEVYVIPGNHDCGLQWSSLSVALGANCWPGIHIVNDKPRYFKYDDMICCLFPHLTKEKFSKVIKDYGSVKEYIKHVTKKDKFDVLVTHAHMDGALSATGTVLDSSGSAIDFLAEEWPKYKLAVLGHVHAHQTHIKDRKHIVYPGSVVTANFGERDNVNGYVSVYKDGAYVRHTFNPFVSTVTGYAQIDIDLTCNNKLSISTDTLNDVKGKLVKVYVLTDDIGKVDEVAIRRVFFLIDR